MFGVNPTLCEGSGSRGGVSKRSSELQQIAVGLCGSTGSSEDLKQMLYKGILFLNAAPNRLPVLNTQTNNGLANPQDESVTHTHIQ